MPLFNENLHLLLPESKLALNTLNSTLESALGISLILPSLALLAQDLGKFNLVQIYRLPLGIRP